MSEKPPILAYSPDNGISRLFLFRGLTIVPIVFLLLTKCWMLINLIRSAADLTSSSNDGGSWLLFWCSLFFIATVTIADVAQLGILIRWKPRRSWVWPLPLYISSPGNLLLAIGASCLSLSIGYHHDDWQSWIPLIFLIATILHVALSFLLFERAEKDQKRLANMPSAIIETQK